MTETTQEIATPAFETPTSLGGMLALANQIEQLLADNGGELTPEIEALLVANNADIPAKVDATVFILKRMAAAADMFKDEADRYSKVAKGLATSHDRLKSYVKNGMLERGLTDLSGDNNRFAITNGAPRLIIESVDMLPDVFTIPIVSRSPNNDMIREELVAGRAVTGARLEPVKQLRTYAAKKVKGTK